MSTLDTITADLKFLRSTLQVGHQELQIESGNRMMGSLGPLVSEVRIRVLLR